MKTYYNSAMKSNKHLESPYKGECSFVRDIQNIAFKWDISKAEKLIDTYGMCDVIYSDPPWLPGIKVFNEKVGASNTASEYYNGLSKVINSIKDIPVYLAVGKSFENRIPEPRWKGRIELNGSDVELWAYNCNELETPKSKTSIEFIQSLSQMYNVVGDFNCGYGNTGRIFKENGKRFVMSDYDGNCINHIKHTLFENIQ